MKKPAHIIEIFLHPGDFYFGDKSTRIRTLLGSCVSIAIWHPGLQIGGMCHYLLPSRAGKRSDTLDGRYAEDAMALFMQEIRQSGTSPAEYEVKLFGGGNMFPKNRHGGGCKDVPCKNVLVGRELVERYGFKIKAEDLGGVGHRRIIFDIWSGDVWVRQNSAALPSQFDMSEDSPVYEILPARALMDGAGSIRGAKG